MSISSDWSSINKEAFAKTFVNCHNALDPIMKRDMIEELGKEDNVKKLLDTMLAEVKKHKMKLEWFARKV